MNVLKECKYIDESFYKTIKTLIENSRKRIYQNIENEILFANWTIGKLIVEKQGGENRSKYGDGLIKELSEQMTKDFGKGFNKSLINA